MSNQIVVTSIDKVEDGSIRIRKNNSRYFHYKRVAPGRWVELHKLNWIAANGPIPKGMVLTCKDEDTLNAAPENWELLSYAENMARNMHRRHNHDEPIEKQCMRCDHSFSTTNANRKVCDQCLEPSLIAKICEVCNKPFQTTKKHKKYCSGPCSKQGYKSMKMLYMRSKRAQEVKRSSTDDRRKETVNPDDMPILNKVTNRNDKDKLRKAKVKSPDHTKMEFKHYDPRMKIMRFFRTREKYNKFLQTIQNQDL